MKAPAFDYETARSVPEALAMLAAHGADGKLLAGGQSLMPMLNFRLLAPAVLVDINRISDLDRIEIDAHGATIGALVRHVELGDCRSLHARLPIFAAVMPHVAHVAIRNVGTIGGSLSHADPAAELALLAVLLDAQLQVESIRGARAVPASDFFVGPLETALNEDEMLTGVQIASLPDGHLWGFAEFARRRGDFALSAAATVLVIEEGLIRQARVALIGRTNTVSRAPEAETVLVGNPPGEPLFAQAAEAVRAAATPEGDLHASPAYRRHLSGVLTARVLAQAWKRRG